MIDFSKISLKSVNPDCYVLCKVAQDVYEPEFPVNYNYETISKESLSIIVRCFFVGSLIIEPYLPEYVTFESVSISFNSRDLASVLEKAHSYAVLT